MATKKTSNFVTVSAGRGNPRYALRRDKLVATTGIRTYRRFTMKGEIRNALIRLFRNNEPSYVLPFYSHGGQVANRATMERQGDVIMIGCHRFSATDVRKLARWTDVAIQ